MRHDSEVILHNDEYFTKREKQSSDIKKKLILKQLGVPDVVINRVTYKIQDGVDG